MQEKSWLSHFSHLTSHGFTLIELAIALLLGTIGVGIIVMLVMQSYNNLNDSRDYADLLSNFDLACYTIKGIIEEAETVSPASGTTDHITVTGMNYAAAPPTPWQSEFYRSGSNLVHESSVHGTGNVITGLSSLTFTPDQTNRKMTVNITVTGLPERIFTVRMRNWE